MKSSLAYMLCAMSHSEFISSQIDQFADNKSLASKLCNNDLDSFFLFTVKCFVCICIYLVI